MPGTVYWFRGVGEGKFAARQELLPAKDKDMSVAMATANLIDFDRDGDLDLIIGDVKGFVSVSLMKDRRSSRSSSSAVASRSATRT